ncbi:MAG: zf-TFIIB domain-containing protein [Chloroflexi bacterium]|nr:zf-TFIIB domain-containing protein [Chloroflexota bacterium]MBI4503906.1 zf-TFIIB domain-containing protein [Chloroflexota bacterium]
MPAAVLGDVEIDFCDRCGLWLDQSELGLLAGGGAGLAVAATGPPPTRPGPRDPFCPRCNRPLAPARIAGAEATSADVVLDVCPVGHGVWFDHGEVERVQIAGKETSPLVAFLTSLAGGKEAGA